MTRICPKRDAICPHGDECRFWIDQYTCDELTTAREMPDAVQLDPDHTGHNGQVVGWPEGKAPRDWPVYVGEDMSSLRVAHDVLAHAERQLDRAEKLIERAKAETEAAYVAGWNAAIEAVIPKISISECAAIRALAKPTKGDDHD